MTAWWSDLSLRERWMVGALGVIILLIALFQFAWRPLADWRAASAERAQAAEQALGLIASAAAQGAVKAGNTTRNEIPLRQAITQSATSSNIELMRIGAELDGRIEVQPAKVGAAQLFAWLSALQIEFGVTVSFADIRRGDDGEVITQVLVFERL